MDLELNDKVAIVTGGSRGIGKAIATELAKEGAKVAIVARDLATSEAAASDIAAKTGRPVYACRADTGKDDDVRAAFSQIVAEHGRIDILVNCAAQPGGQQAARRSLPGSPTRFSGRHQHQGSRIFALRAGGCPQSCKRHRSGRIINVWARRTADRVNYGLRSAMSVSRR